MKSPRNSSQRFVLFSLCSLLIFSAACNRGASPGAPNAQSSAKRYAFKGKVISVDKNARAANISNETIPGFMDPMVMPYAIKPPAMLDQLQPGDTITADVVVRVDNVRPDNVQPNNAQPDNTYWLENVKVVAHSQPASDKPTSSIHIPSPGDQVPDFQLVNQNGQHTSLHQYRGKTLLLTLIYTHCPFPDFCPRVSHEFAAIDRQVRADPSRFGKTHLLSISFDPAHDTPKVLRAYGFSCAATKDPALFTHWEFSAIPEPELQQFADYFALTYNEDGGLITHSLSTAIISPDGKIYRWYHGADWQASDLLQDIAAARSAS